MEIYFFVTYYPGTALNKSRDIVGASRCLLTSFFPHYDHSERAKQNFCRTKSPSITATENQMWTTI